MQAGVIAMRLLGFTRARDKNYSKQVVKDMGTEAMSMFGRSRKLASTIPEPASQACSLELCRFHTSDLPKGSAGLPR